MEKFREVQDIHTDRKTGGYCLLDLILSLSIIAFLLLLAIPLNKNITYLNQLRKDTYLYQDEIGIYQLQLLLAKNKITEVNPDEIYYQSAESECYISVVNDNLISQPGYLCYLRKVEDVYFYESWGIIYIEYYREGEYHVYPIAYVFAGYNDY